MTTERLIELNRSGYLTTNRFNRADLEIVQNTLDKLAFHHGLSDGPQPGDIVEGAYYDGAFPYRNGRLTEVGGGKVTVCCHAYTPFVSFTAKGKPVLSTSGGPFMSHDIGELEPAGTEKACYKVWGCYGPCANGAISVETTVRRWRIPYERRPLSYITVLDELDKGRYPTLDAKVILHVDHMQFFARYRNMEQLDALAGLMGFTYTENKDAEKPGYRSFRLSHQLTEGPGFWRREDLPSTAVPYKDYSNGSLCTCYFLRNDKEKSITVFRPNPNSKQVYDPMNQKEKMAYTRVHGEAGPVPVSIKETVTITIPVYVI